MYFRQLKLFNFSEIEETPNNRFEGMLRIDVTRFYRSSAVAELLGFEKAFSCFRLLSLIRMKTDQQTRKYFNSFSKFER